MTAPNPLLLLYLHVADLSVEARSRIALAMTRLGFDGDHEHAFRIEGTQSQPVRDLVELCRREGCTVWLMAELDAAAADDGPYVRRRDRSEHHADAIARWCGCSGPLPSLGPGEIVRL